MAKRPSATPKMTKPKNSGSRVKKSSGTVGSSNAKRRAASKRNLAK